MIDTVQVREEVVPDNTWNVAAFYSTNDAWEEELTHQQERWAAIGGLKGKLGESPATTAQALETFFDLQRSVANLYVYAHLRNDEDVANDFHKGMFQKASSLYHEFATEMSWIEPELVALPDETLQQYMKSSELAEYSFYLEKLYRMKQHTLSPREEELVALAGKALSTPHDAYGQLTNADFKFGTVVDSEGNEHELTQGSYSVLLRSQDRTLRENAFKAIHNHYLANENTLAELLNGQLQGHIFHAKAHHFDSSLDAALYPKDVDTSVYRSLVSSVRKHLPTLHRYMALRKQVMGVDELHLWDVYTPLVPSVDRSIPYDEAVQLNIDAVAVLGPEYQSKFAKGMTADRWVDRYENTGKRSGAYSSGSYDSMPYILMNYKGKLRDVYTLIHEGGHSMQSLLSNENQPYHYAGYPIFVAEVASIFNEDQLFRHLLSKAETDEERAYYINGKLEDMRATLFRQAMFAEFELTIHEMAEAGEPITPASLKEKYRQLNVDYFGPDVVIDEEIGIEWARIPHFYYYNFYVYQYATGISAALALSERVNNGGEAERDAYLNFLKSGGRKYPIELLQDAGVDMTTSEPVDAALQRFDALVDELEGSLTPLKLGGNAAGQ